MRRQGLVGLAKSKLGVAAQNIEQVGSAAARMPQNKQRAFYCRSFYLFIILQPLKYLQRYVDHNIAG